MVSRTNLKIRGVSTAASGKVCHTRFQQRTAVAGQPLYRVSDGVRSTHGRDGAIVLDLHEGQMFNLNLVGSKILELLECGLIEPEIVDAISREFNTSREVVEKDVREFIESLKDNKLVTER